MLRSAIVAAVVIGMGLLCADRAWADPPRNLDFEADAAGSEVSGWFVPPVCAQAGWTSLVSENSPAEGQRCAVLSRKRGDEGGAAGTFGNLMQAFDAAPFRGKRVVVTMQVKLGTVASGRVQPWIREDRAGEKSGVFDNCADRAVTERTWKTVTLAGNVNEDAQSINIGVMVIGGDGPVFVDGVTIQTMDAAPVRADPPRELSGRGLANVEVAARLLGLVRHYYPGDEASAADWERFSVDAILAAEPAENAGALADVLTRVFAPVAPAMRVSASPIDGPFDPGLMIAAGEKPLRVVAWKHRGFNPSGARSDTPYRSERVDRAVDDPPLDDLPDIGSCVRRDWTVGPGERVSVRMPIALYKDEHGTLPHPTSSYAPPANAPELSVEDRATRLAGVAIAWNVLEHHYPYFDEVKVDWNAALTEALRSAATDANADAYQLTLERLVARLHDGHGNVGSRLPRRMYALPLALTFVGEDVVVENAFGSAVPKGVLPGDVVTGIGGTPIAELVAFAREHEPAATEGFFHSRAARRICERATKEPTPVDLRSPDGTAKTVMLTPIGMGEITWGRTGPIVAEKKPGIWYIDLDRATDKDLSAAMPALAKATGIVFDMRGYPNRFSMGMLGHLSEKRLQCARWEIPLANRPDREGVTFDRSRWELPPLKPRLKGKVAFITDGRAISAAETFMGIVEHYKLAEIVGEPTAGTNGNINTIKLPAGYTVVFTGMKVLKHDGSPHHGVGIQPTVLVHRTIAGIAAGKDEMLEKAMEVVEGGE